MPALRIAAVVMLERGHLHRVLAVVGALTARGHEVHVLTAAAFADEVRAAGARFVDLFARFPLEAADAESLPFASRYVSFAARYLDGLTALLAGLAPALVLYDTFALVAPLAARRLGLPYVNVCAGHAARPERVLAELARSPRVATSAACWAAVRELRERGDLPDAHPHAYVTAQSPFLNLYGEPRQFLDEDDRASFEPLAFYGSVTVLPAFRRRERVRQVYASFGTVVWRALPALAAAAMQQLADAFAPLDVELRISLGDDGSPSAPRPALVAPRARVERYVDQREALAAADVFVTHHGLNSSHEAIVAGVPMLSVPFFGDQPSLARRCQALGLALPLQAEHRGPITAAAVAAAVARLGDEAAAFADRLEEARGWELATLADRPAILDRLVGLAGSSS